MNSNPQFGSGIERARQLRRQLLDALSAEPEWTWGDDGDDIMMWSAGPLGTRFFIEPVGENVPDLSILHIFTTCARVDDVAAARAAVEDLNFHTTFGRWSILNDPDLRYEYVDELDAFQLPLLPWYDPDVAPTVTIGLSLVVGDEDIEFPFAAMRAMVADTICKATAVTTGGFADTWGSPAVVYNSQGEHRLGPDWNPVVEFYNSNILPFAMTPQGALTQALVTAFDMERQVQFQQSPAAWFGSGDESGFSCEVPYGPGPFPLGVIGMQSGVPHLSGPRTATSLVQGLPTDNPWLGNGLVFAVTSGGNDSDLPLPEWGAAALLNAQNRLRSDDASPGFAHAVGSWVKRNSNMTHVCFIPAGWDRLLTEEELIRFFRISLANAARLSWGSRQVLEPNRDRPTHDPTHPRMLAGLAAGANARGPQFGEPGSGTNPGARALTFIWDKLVGSDDEFARVFDDVAGFRFWMGPAVLDITSHRCTCPSESGSLIVLESDLGNDTPEDRERLVRLQETGLPFAVVTTSGRLAALAQIHVHDDTLSFGAYWAVPLAVAMVLLADELSPPDARGIDLRLPGGEERTSRDGMLGTLGSHGLWASETPFGAGKSETRSPLNLLHAQLLVDSPGWRVAEREGTLSVSRKYPVGRGEDWEAKSLDTVCHYMTHPIYGTCLRLETSVPALGDVDAWRITGEFARDSFTLLGGFTPDAEGIRLVTLYPTAIDSSRTHAGEVSFAGTAMQHHALVIRMALNRFDALVGHDVDPDQGAAGVTDLVEAYRTTAGLPEQLQIGAGVWHGEVGVQWMRPWPYTGADTSPRLASDIEIDGEPWLAGQVTLDLATVGSFTERILHAVLALSAPLPEPISGPGPLLGELIPMLGPAECENICARATAYFDIRKDEDDRYVILSEDDRVIAQFVVETRDDHQAWGTSLDVVARMLVPADTDYGDPRLVHPWVIGAWSERDDMLEFRISLPPAVLAGRDSQSILAEVVVCAAPVIAHARAAARRLE